jgi:molybdopterin synthase catalytic subunit
MATKELSAIADEIERERPGTLLSCLHRTGTLAVGDVAVICAASAPHRGDAFAACRELIDRLKARVPIWKREHGENGPYWIGWQDVRGGG